MSFINNIIAKLAGFDPQETQEATQATLARTQSGHEAMPDHTAGGEKFRQEAQRETNLAHEREQAQQERVRQQMMQNEAKQHGGIEPQVPGEEIEIAVPEDEKEAA